MADREETTRAEREPRRQRVWWKGREGESRWRWPMIGREGGDGGELAAGGEA